VPSRRKFVLPYLLLLALSCVTTLNATDAQTTSVETLKTEIYFGARMADGQVLGEEAWNQFLTEVVMSRFPAGLTALEAFGRGGTHPGPLTRVRILVLVHPSGEVAQTRLREIKAEYKKRFKGAGIFHTQQPIRIRSDD
jgi:hypothetical protein